MRNFDQVIDRKNTHSLKYDFAVERGMPNDVLPLWVADMDFQVPQEVTDALVKTSRHGIFGYSEVKDDYFQSVHDWFLGDFGFHSEPDWLVKTPGVVFAIAMAVRALSAEGDAVLIQQPVYYPFFEVILANHRQLINNPLVYENGTYRIDFDDFEKKIIKNKVRLFILCSPHNPVGRVWTKDELIQMGNICKKYDCLIVSDEIHCDFVYEGYKHFCFGAFSEEFLDNSIICTAPSKTFNMAGLQISNIFIANEKFRKSFEAEIRKTGYSQLNTMGLVACMSAYRYGKPWLDHLKKYLSDNMVFTRDFLRKKIPKIKLVESQGMYLLWLDCRELKLSQNELCHQMTHKGKLWLDDGMMFGPEGAGFLRMNIACPREVLETALLRLEQCFA